MSGLDDKVLQAYFKYMLDFTMIFDVDSKEAEKELAESLDFEKQLAKVWSSSATYSNYDINKKKEKLCD